MQIKISIKRGNTSVHIASLLLDLWQDYIYYRMLAESVNYNKQPLLYKRHTRAAIHSYFGYFEGVINNWISKISPSTNLEKTYFDKKIKMIQEVMDGKSCAPKLDLKRARRIRNTIVHIKPSTPDVDVMELLLEGRFFCDADLLTTWLDFAADALKLERHPDMSIIMKNLEAISPNNI